MNRHPIHIPTWSFRKANWDKYATLISRYIAAPPEDANLNLAIEKFSGEVIRAAREAIPTSKPNPRKRMVPWWNEECSRAVRRKRAAFLKMKRSFRYADIIQFKELRALARKTILHAKKSYWKNFCDNLNTTSNISYVWNVVKSMNQSRTLTTIKSLKCSDNMITSPKEIANCLAEWFSKISSNRNLDSQEISRRQAFNATRSLAQFEITPDNHEINAPITMTELKIVRREKKGHHRGQMTYAIR